jgi:hypothetical protein
MRVAQRMGINQRMLQRWNRQFAAQSTDDGCDDGDRRKGSRCHVPHSLSPEESQRILVVCKQPQ